jgi:hypothetical protein
MSETDTIPSFPYTKLKHYAIRCLSRRISLLIFGHPGIGKSSLAADLAAHFALPLIDIRLSHRDPSELAGIQMPDRDGRLIVVYPPDWLHRICESPHVLFLDEISAGVTKLHQAVAYQILNDRCLGPYRFHPDTLVLGASNLPEDNAIVSPLSDALIDRVARAILEVNVDEWLHWAVKQTPPISPDIRAWIAFKGQSALYRRYDMAMTTPRSWARASLLEQPLPGESPLKDTERRKLIAMCVGVPMATEYSQFLTVYRSIDLDGFLKQGTLPALTEHDPSMTYAFIFALVDRLASNKKLPVPTSTLFRRLASLFAMPTLGDEYLVLFLKQLMPLKPSLVTDMLTSQELRPLCAALAGTLQDLAA